MKLEGKKVKLRATEPEDIELLYEWENDVDNWFVSDTIAPYSRHQLMEFVKNNNDIYSALQCRFMIDDHKGQSVGCIDIYEFDPKNHRCGIGVLISPQSRGVGFGTEALSLALDYCFETLSVHSVFAYILSDNAPSIKMFEALGFTKSGVRREWKWDGSTYHDELFYQRIFKLSE